MDIDWQCIPRHRCWNWECTLPKFCTSSWYDVHFACRRPETLTVGSGGNRCRLGSTVERQSTLADTVCTGSGSRLVASEVVAKPAWRTHADIIEISILWRHSGFIGAGEWDISVGWWECSCNSPVCWWPMRGESFQHLLVDIFTYFSE